MTRIPRTLAAVLLTGALLLGGAFPPRTAAQCAMCKDAVYSQADQERRDQLGGAFNASVYGMLGVPAALLTGLVLVIRRNLRAHARRENGRTPKPPS